MNSLQKFRAAAPAPEAAAATTSSARLAGPPGSKQPAPPRATQTMVGYRLRPLLHRAAFCCVATLALAAEPAIDSVCRVGCRVVPTACNHASSATTQQWLYQPGAQQTLALRSSVMNATSQSLCLNVKAAGTAAGDLVWVTLCHPEHPLSANEGWAFSADGKLQNTRSKLCAVVSGDSKVVLGSCAGVAASSWQFNSQSGHISTDSGAHCLTVSDPPAPSPPPPPSPPTPAVVGLSNHSVVNTVDERFVSFTMDVSIRLLTLTTSCLNVCNVQISRTVADMAG
jgi:hypothetical protein